MNLQKQLEATGLLDEFITFARKPGVNDAALTAWCKARPDLAALAYLPRSFGDLRQKLNCSAPKGGARPGGGRSPLHVGRMREGVRLRSRVPEEKRWL